MFYVITYGASYGNDPRLLVDQDFLQQASGDGEPFNNSPTLCDSVHHT